MRKFPGSRLFVMEFVSQTVAIYTLYAIMFGERGGLSLPQVGLVLGIFSLTTIVAEVPTGAIADHFSRKWSLVLSKIVLALGMLIWLLFPGLAGYIAGIIMMGVSDSLSSGAIQAYLYEQMGKNKEKFTHYNSRLWAAMMGGWLVGSGLASLIGPRYEMLLVLSILSPAVGAILAIFLPSDRNEVMARRHSEPASLLKNTHRAAKYVFSSRPILYSISSIIIIKVLVDVLIEYIPLYYRAAGASTRIIPILFFIGNAITVILFWHGKHIANLLRRRELVLGTLMVLLLIVTSSLGTVASILGIFWYVRFVRILFVVQEGEVQHLLIDRHRATVTSIYSMATRLLMALSFVLIGHFASGKSGVITPILVFVAVLYFAYIIIHRRARTKPTEIRSDPIVGSSITSY